MKDNLHTVVIPGGASIGPLPLSELRERLRREPVPEDCTVIIHTRLGDQFMPISRHPELRSQSLPRENCVLCPHCDTTQPTTRPGEATCIRCGTKLIISEDYIVTLGANPNRLWSLSIPGIFGLIAFTTVYPNETGLWASLTIGFGVPFVLMLRQGVAYSKSGKFTAREDPICYAAAVVITGIFTLVGAVFLFISLK